MSMLSAGVRRKAKRLNVGYRFLFMKASGQQLERITALIHAGTIRPVMDKVFPFADPLKGLAGIETGRAKGKVVIKVQ